MLTSLSLSSRKSWCKALAACAAHSPQTRRQLCIYVSIRQHTSAFVSVCVCSMRRTDDIRMSTFVYVCQHTSAYVSIRQHTSAYVSICVGSMRRTDDTRMSTFVYVRQHTAAYVSIRQHTSAYALSVCAAQTTHACRHLFYI
jgi:hypothetical protein